MNTVISIAVAVGRIICTKVLNVPHPSTYAGFLKLVGDVLEALTHHEDIKSVLESETRNGEYPKRNIGVQEVYIRILEQLETGDNSSAEEVEYSEDTK